MASLERGTPGHCLPTSPARARRAWRPPRRRSAAGPRPGRANRARCLAHDRVPLGHELAPCDEKRRTGPRSPVGNAPRPVARVRDRLVGEPRALPERRRELAGTLLHRRRLVVGRLGAPLQLGDVLVCRRGPALGHVQRVTGADLEAAGRRQPLLVACRLRQPPAPRTPARPPPEPRRAPARLPRRPRAPRPARRGVPRRAPVARGRARAAPRRPSWSPSSSASSAATASSARSSSRRSARRSSAIRTA